MNLINHVGRKLAGALVVLKIKHLSCGHLACESCDKPDLKDCKACKKNREEIWINLETSMPSVIQVVYEQRNIKHQDVLPVLSARTVNSQEGTLKPCFVCVAILAVLGLMYGASRMYS